MKYLETGSTNPYYNLAFEEYVLKNLTDDDYLLLWQNENTIVIGKNQCTIAEINLEEVEKQKVNVVRRNTGGGAVYHDLGNLNFSYITNWSEYQQTDYDRFLNPVIKALNSFGLETYKQGRNDILLDDKKISGNAQAIIKNRILHHGTILFNSNLCLIQNLLNVDKAKYESKGLKSVRSRVTNISDYLKTNISIEELKEALIKSFLKESKLKITNLDKQQLEEINSLAKNKYESWDWNYGKSPKFTYNKKKYFTGGTVQISLDIENNIIKNCSILGDFLALKDVSEIENLLENKRYDKEEITNIILTIDTKLYFGDISLDEILSCVF